MALPRRKRKNEPVAPRTVSKESVASGPPPTKKSKVARGAAAVAAALLSIEPRNTVPGQVLTVGEGDTGQLGLGPDTMDCKRFKPVPEMTDVIDVCAGGMHTLCLTKDGKVYSFGCNDESALGRSAAEEDSETQPDLVEGLKGLKVVQLAAGDSFSAALTQDGAVFVWGTYRDSSGGIGLVEAGRQEPVPRQLPLPGPVARLCVQDSSGGIGLVEAGRQEPVPRQLPLPAPVARLSAGSNHLAMLDTAGHLYTAGNAEQGQLGRVPEMFSVRGARRGLEFLLQPQRVTLGGRARHTRFDAVWTGAFSTIVRAADSQKLFGCGLNNYNQLSLNQLTIWQLTELRRFHEIKVEEFSGAMHHSVCRDSEGRVYTLGRKEDGRLGLPDLAHDLDTPTPVTGVKDRRFRSVSAAGYVTMAVTEEGQLYSWGMGTTGQLGLGDDEDRTEPELVRGKFLEDKEIVFVSAGGTHTVVMARPRQVNGH